MLDAESTRALERILVREGGFVLPAGAFDVEPRLGYEYRGRDDLTIVDAGTGPQVTTRNVRRDTFAAGVAVRAGLPFRSQVEIRVPFVLDRQVAVLGVEEQSSEASGLGDVEITATKQLTSGAPRAIGLLGAFTLKTSTGEHDPDELLSPGSGYQSIQATLIGVKRQDPLVLYTNLYHTLNLEEDDIDAGETTGFRMGLLLAANPDTSLRTTVEFSRTGELELSGRTVPGSAVTYVVFEIGIATALTERTLLDLRLGAGVTSDSPDFILGLSLPIRFQ